MTEKIYGIKGFDKNLNCRGHQYELDKEYKMTESPKLCARGFHYSMNTKDCFVHYKNDGKNRFCLVEILGTIDSGVGKNATNHIKILRELTTDEINGKYTVTPQVLKSLCNKGYVIGGSWGLKIHGYDLSRELGDVDLIIDADRDTDKDFVGFAPVNVFSGLDSIRAYRGVMGEKYDILKTSKIYPVKRIYNGEELLVQDENEIWKAKLKYALGGSLKHMNDITLKGIEFDVVTKKNTSTNDMMPF